MWHVITEPRLQGNIVNHNGVNIGACEAKNSGVLSVKCQNFSRCP